MINISVIVTIYNLEAYIKACLDSILSQKGVEFEIVCVNDASTDKSGAILEEYQKGDSRITIINTPFNVGLASARNEGLRHANGEYLYNIDGDDLLAEGALKRMYNYLKEYDLDLLAFSAKAFFDDECSYKYGNEDDYVRNYEYVGVYEGPELFALLMKNGDRVSSNRVLYCYKRSYFIENNLFDEEGLRYADDSMFSFYMTAKRAMCVSDQLYLRRYRKNSAVTSPMKKRYLESMVVLYMYELCRWRSMDLKEEINYQVGRYFDIRLKEIGWLRKLFQEDQTEIAYLKKHPSAYYFYNRFIEQGLWNIRWITDEQLIKIKQAKEIILYGAGYIATEVAKELEYFHITNYTVAVTKKNRSEDSFNGKEIHNIMELVSINNALVIVAMSLKYKKEIMSILENNGFQNIIWIAF